MNWHQYELIEQTNSIPDVHILKLKPLHIPIRFIPGQYVLIKNPQYEHPEEEHAFSIASTPNDQYLEFCIREYGFWTQEVKKLRNGDVLQISDAKGEFIFDKNITNAVFLCGGVGISPIISILRALVQTSSDAKLTLLYGSRTPNTVVYEDELGKLQKLSSCLKINHIFSDYTPDKFRGYHGFITKKIIEKEVSLLENPDWFLTGPPIFIEKMKEILSALKVSLKRVHTENIS